MSSKALNHSNEDRAKVLLEGYLRKLKTMKKKYFVVRGNEGEASSCLEYYDNEKKFRAGLAPKRCIELKMCFNINRRTDTKYKSVIALYNKDDVFCIVMDDEKQLEDWLRMLLLLQNGGEDQVDGGQPKPIFEYTWKVKVQDKGLGLSHNMVGHYYVCLSDMKLCLVKVSDTRDFKEFALSTIRSCGGTESFFYMEVGRQSCTGAGELWMLTEDPNIANNMSEVIQRAFSRDRDADPYRKRSCSATEMNRPMGTLQRRLTQGSGKIVPPYSGFSWNAAQPAPPTVSVSPPIDVHYRNVTPSLHYAGRVSALAVARPASLRRHSVSAVSCNTSVARAAAATSASPAVTSHVPDAVPSTVISHQRTKSCPVSDTSLPVIVEPHRVMSQSHVSFPYPDGDRRYSGSTYRRPGSAKCTSAMRERCDSMPSRNRTTSEGTHKSSMRPASMRVSYSPPGPCSTDSAGSSLSIDETDHAATPDENTIFEEEVGHWPVDPELEAEMLDRMSLGYDRPPASLSRPIGAGRGRKVSSASTQHGSPCGSSPAQTNDYMVMSPGDGSGSGVRRARSHAASSPSTSDYVPMSPGDPSRASAVGSPSSNYMPLSPADSQSLRAGTVMSSPSNHSDYMAMSPGVATSTASMDYLPMSPGDGRGKRPASRDDDDYVPMAPTHSDDGYVDMDPLHPNHPFRHDDHHSDLSADSSSATSGTPSDQYLLEKVSAYFTEEEEDARPTRTYSFGSQPPTRSRIEAVKAVEAARVRAFSMGNQQRPTAHKFSMRPTSNVKFPSAPLLTTSWSGNNRIVPQPDPLADRMEMDFTKKARAARYRPVVETLVTHKNSSADSGYMDMSSKSPPCASPPKPASSKHLFSPPDGKSSLGRKPPHVTASSTLKTIGEKPDIKPQKFPNTTKVPERPYMEMKPRTVSQSSADGYMDMTPVAIKLARKNSADYMQMKAARKASDATNDYMSMQPARKISTSSSDYMAMVGTKRSSEPIAIVAPSSPTTRETASNPPQPPNYLPLHSASSSTSSLNFFSLGRKRKNRKKNERRDSKENIATSTGIFPLSLNSPQSPKKAEDTTFAPEPVPASDPDSLSRVLRTSDQDNAAADDAATEPVVPSTQARATPPQHRSEESSTISRLPQGSMRARGTCESCRSKKNSTESHPGVSRQVSTSSSSSTEVSSVKEGACGGAAASEKDITYASLDLPHEGAEPRSPRPSPAPSPAPLGEQFIYAEIDFQKSESLRAPAHSFRKIRH